MSVSLGCPLLKKQEGFKSDIEKNSLTRPVAKQRIVLSKRGVDACAEVVVSDL